MEKTKKVYRLYAFPHRWLSPIQKGIQTSHAVAELMTKSVPPKLDATVWARDHKTIILFEGGPSAYLKKLVDALKKSNLTWADFHEDEYSLEGARTAVVVVVDVEEMKSVLGGDFVEKAKQPFNVKVYEMISEGKLASS